MIVVSLLLFYKMTPDGIHTGLAKRVGHGLREFQQSLRNRKEIEDRIGELPRLHTYTESGSIFNFLLHFPNILTDTLSPRVLCACPTAEIA